MDFHEDLFPDVFGWGGVDAEEWFNGSQKAREKVSMDPAKQKPRTPASEKQPNQDEPPGQSQSNPSASKQPPEQPTQPSNLQPPLKLVSPTSYTRKFLTGKLHHPQTHFTSLPAPHPSLAQHLTSTSREIGYPLSGPGGRIALIPLNSPGRVETPRVIETGGNVVDFALCPFLGGVVVVAGEDGVVRVLREDGGGVVEDGRMETDKVVQVGWHPYVDELVGVLHVGSSGMEFRLWDFRGGHTKSFPLPYTVVPLLVYTDG